MAAQQLHINADSEASGVGTFTIVATKTLSTTNGVLSLTAADVQLQGALNSGTAVINLHTTNQRTIGLGTTSQDMDIEHSEVQQLTALGLVVGRTVTNKSCHEPDTAATLWRWFPARNRYVVCVCVCVCCVHAHTHVCVIRVCVCVCTQLDCFLQSMFPRQPRTVSPRFVQESGSDYS